MLSSAGIVPGLDAQSFTGDHVATALCHFGTVLVFSWRCGSRHSLCAHLSSTATLLVQSQDLPTSIVDGAHQRRGRTEDCANPREQVLSRGDLIQLNRAK